ncbi:hypothetical protein MasN3_04460 [Massilia varians]|uniref:Uncharacterized protein n=1 Tax=Massilia varians TaxID=457921 RepID=A0ABM8C1G2_9BURK|nr:hypothetical protein MasN3_04460 [Massilia varians]
MFTPRTLATACACAWFGLAMTPAAPAHAASAAAAPRAEVIHWWTSGGESAAVKQVAQAYRDAGGVWIDTAIAGGDQSRAVTINRIVGGNPPTAAQFNTSKQFLDVIEAGMLNNVDGLARAQNWDRLLPPPDHRRDQGAGSLLRGAAEHPHADLVLVFEGRLPEGRHRKRAGQHA